MLFWFFNDKIMKMSSFYSERNSRENKQYSCYIIIAPYYDVGWDKILQIIENNFFLNDPAEKWGFSDFFELRFARIYTSVDRFFREH